MGSLWTQQKMDNREGATFHEKCKIKFLEIGDLKYSKIIFWNLLKPENLDGQLVNRTVENGGAEKERNSCGVSIVILFSIVQDSA